MRIIAIIGSLIMAFGMQAQTIDLRFLPQWNGAAIVPGQTYTGLNNEKIKIEILALYVATFETPSEEFAPIFHLLQWTEDVVDDTCRVDVRDGQLQLQFGVDSLTRSRGVMRGDLDPMLGYYWTWQSGYIHLKCEGIWDNGKGQSKRFTWHLGGSEANACVSIHNLKLPIDHSVVWDLGPIFEQGLPPHCEIMSPSPVAKLLFDKFILCMQGL